MLGAGPAGLAAAWWAARTGRSVVVVERAPAVGGLAASFEVAGVRVDHGSHRLHPATDPGILAELRALLGDDLQRRPRRGRLRMAGRWVPFPPRPASLARALPPAVALALARDLALAPLRRPRADTYAEVVRAGVGPTLGEHLYHPLARKLWGTAPEDLAGEQARRRIGAASPAAILVRALRGGGGTGHFLYPRRGFGQIGEALAGAAAAAGAEIRTGAEVAAIEAGPRSARLHLAGGAAVEAGMVLSTIPLGTLAGLVRPAAPAGVAAAAAAQRSRAMVLVYLVVDRAPWTPFDAHYLPEAAVAASRVSEPRNYRDGDDPPDRSVLCVEVPCWPGDATWRAADADLAAAAAADLGRSGLAVEPVGWEVRRVGSVYPVYHPGFERGLAVLEAWVARFPALVTLGRQGLAAHDNTHHTLAMSRAAVEALRPDGGFDHARWSREREGFRSHVVED